MTWQIVAHKCELANPGDYVLLPWTADGEIAVTNIDGQIVAFDNRCPHRGARIFTELRGNRPPVCGYHGRCARADQVTRIHSWRYGDWILAKSTAKSIIPMAILDMIEETPPLTLHSTLSILMDCHWTVAVENALDFEHVALVHRSSLAKLKLRSLSVKTYSGGSSVEEFSAGASLDRLGRFFPHARDFDYLHAHLAPYTCISSTRGWTYSLQNYFPRAGGGTNFVHRLYTAPTTRPLPAFFDSVAKLNAQVFAEDAAICALVSPSHDGSLDPHEERIRHFRASVNDDWRNFKLSFQE